MNGCEGISIQKLNIGGNHHTLQGKGNFRNYRLKHKGTWKKNGNLRSCPKNIKGFLRQNRDTVRDRSNQNVTARSSNVLENMR